MPSENPKSQHFVHRAYLQGFQDPALVAQGKRALWLYMPGKHAVTQIPERVAKRNYYYCYRENDERQFLVEHGLQELEDATLPILLRLRQGDFALAVNDRLTFAGYVALSHTRVPTFEKFTNRIAALSEAKKVELFANNPKALTSLLAEHEARTGERLDPEDFRRKLTGGNVVVTQTDRAWSIKQMFTTMMALQKLIFEMHWSFLKAPSESDGFLTSDNPVSLFDPLEGPMRGIGFLSSPAVHFTFPISKDICLLARRHTQPLAVDLTASEVRQTNTGTITRADGQLYAPFRSHAVQELFDHVFKQKNPTRRVMLKQGRVVEE